MFTRRSVLIILVIAAVTLLGFVFSTPPRQNSNPAVYELPLSLAAYPGLRDWKQYEINGMLVFVLLPNHYTPSRKYPVLLYLHGQGTGEYPELLMEEVNPWFHTASWRKSYPAIVICPCLDDRADYTGLTINFGGFSPESSDGENNAIAAVALVEHKYAVDKSRIYVTGISLGACGVWEMLIKYNARNGTQGKIFAAGMPLAGSIYDGNDAVSSPPQSVIDELQHVPIWAIHGAQDDAVPAEWDNAMGAALGSNQSFHLTIDPNLSHDVWDTYYPLPTGKSYWDWLFAQRAP